MTYHRIEFTRGFAKQFKKLTPRQKQKFYARLRLFKQEPYAKVLNNHGLEGKYLGYRSINVEGDFRVLYRIKDDVVVIFAFIGSHAKLYG